MTRGFVLDLNKCTGCHACTLACAVENGLEAGTSWRQVYTYNAIRHPAAPVFHLSLACHHCRDAVCMKSCPAAAYRREASTGAVILDPELCIGCRYCGWACPFDAPRYDADDGVMTKCTFCHDRMTEGLNPACVALCPTGALQYGGLDETGVVERVPGFPAADILPSIRFIPLRQGRSQPECSALAGPVSLSFGNTSDCKEAKIGPASEWPLAIFTFLASLLVAVLAASLLSPLAIDPYGFLGLGAAGIGLSSIHLGRRRRAWRAVLNPRRSWLSREVILYSAFLILSAVFFFVSGRGSPTGWIAVLVGFGGLFAIDRVYEVAAGKVVTYLHSAGALLTGVFLAGILAGSTVIFGLTALVKTMLYSSRKASFIIDRRPVRPLVSGLRIVLGILVPAVLWLTRPELWYGFAVAGALCGELIDRSEYYLELNPLSPEGRMAVELKAHLARSRSPAGLNGKISAEEADTAEKKRE